MAEKNTKLTPFQKEQAETFNKIREFKLNCEANIVATIYKSPETIYDLNLSVDDFDNNIYASYFAIAHGIMIEEKKASLDSITVGLYLEKHPKLKEKYEEYGGYDTIEHATAFINIENLPSYVEELHKWSAVIALCKAGFPVKNNLSKYVDQNEEQIYSEYEAYLNHIFTNTTSGVKSYNVFEGMHQYIEELNDCKDVGIPFHNAPHLTAMTGGWNLNGNIYGLGSNSGMGKSTMAFNLIVPSAIETGEKVVFIINEEDERKFKKELLVWVANNVFKEELHKHTLRDGHFSPKELELLKKCADWIEQKKDERIFTVIPLEHYSVNIAIKIIKKYSSAYGVRMFVLDTLKESCDAKTDEIYKSMMRDMVQLYDTVKPSAKNVGLFVTYQLGKSSLKMRYYTNSEIGQAKSIIDVMSVNIMMRRPYEDEYYGCSNALECYCKKGNNSKTEYKLYKKDNPMILFVTKNRFGEANTNQIIMNCDLSTNTYKDVAFCNVPQDF